MLAGRIVSLSWRLKRVERMNSEAIDVMIARAETNRWQKEEREEAGLLDPENGRSELALGWAIMRDFSESQVLERLLMYEKRIESSLYKAMNELQKLQRIRKTEESKAAEVAPDIPIPINDHRDEAATHSEDESLDFEKQSQLQKSPPSTLSPESIKIAALSDCSAFSANSAVIEKTKPIAGLRPGSSKSQTKMP